MSGKVQIVSVVGARPQFIKLAPLIKALKEPAGQRGAFKWKHLIIHTGQHYDYMMNQVFFHDLGIPEPDFNLEVGSDSHGRQTGNMLKKIEDVLVQKKPQLVIVYGDTNSTLAGALCAAKLHIPVAHVEAGLRSYNKKMPEEINRILTDHCSDVLLTPTENASRILRKEGITNIFQSGILINFDHLARLKSMPRFPVAINIGDIMFDAVLLSLKIAEKKSDILTKLNLRPKNYFLATVHRAENTDFPRRLKAVMDALITISKERPVVFPVHPRTMKQLKKISFPIKKYPGFLLLDPVGYFDMLILEKNAAKILTDSGGMQKEAFFLKTPCITLRDETEWIETIETGSNILVSPDKNQIEQEALQSFSGNFDSTIQKPFGDGHSADRIVTLIKKVFVD